MTNATDREKTTQRATEFIDRFCKVWPGVPTYVLSPIWRADHLTRREDDFRHEEIREILLRCAENNPQIKVINGYELFPRIEALMFDERLHPNELGFVIYANRLAAELDKFNPQK